MPVGIWQALSTPPIGSGFPAGWSHDHWCEQQSAEFMSKYRYLYDIISRIILCKPDVVLSIVNVSHYPYFTFYSLWLTLSLSLFLSLTLFSSHNTLSPSFSLFLCQTSLAINPITHTYNVPTRPTTYTYTLSSFLITSVATKPAVPCSKVTTVSASTSTFLDPSPLAIPILMKLPRTRRSRSFSRPILAHTCVWINGYICSSEMVRATRRSISLVTCTL